MSSHAALIVMGYANQTAILPSEMYQKILSDPLTFPAEISPDARSLLTGLLTREPSARLGVNGAEEIKKHPFFSKHIDWKMLMAKKIQPPFKPSVESSVDTSNVSVVIAVFNTARSRYYVLLISLNLPVRYGIHF